MDLTVRATSPASSVARVTNASSTPDAAAAANAAGGAALGGRAGAITTETLPNGVRLVIAQRPGAQSTKIQVGVGAGSNQDPVGKLGMAHLLEHLAFEGSPTRTATVQEKLRNSWGNLFNAYTDTDSIVYYGIVPNKDATAAAKLIADMYQHPATTGVRVGQEKAAVENEMVYYDSTVNREMSDIVNRQIWGEQPWHNNVIGTRKSVDAITAKDMQAFHQAYFTGRNTVVLVEGDAKSMPLDTIRSEFGALAPGARVDQGYAEVPIVPGQSLQTIRDTSRGAAEITFSLPLAQHALDGVNPMAQELVLTALNSRLNNVLRRYDRTTYGAFAELTPDDATTGPLLQVTGTIAADKVQQAVADMASILRDSRDGFGAQALKLDKQTLLSRLAMKEPAGAASNSDLAESTFQLALSQAGVDIVPDDVRSPRTQNRHRDASIRSARALDAASFTKAASQIVDLANAKVLAYGDVQQADLLAGLKAGGFDTRKLTLNPVDMSTYKDMGLGTPHS